ncbi:MAG: hypothetical protein E7Z97_02560 [Propionibacteriaceae bacterium]|uniref:Uncharacterized protein n=1 Tax=Propionibacterium ruminifibrarum TaxID=1962131 RepID=A0A375I5X7_9ACTN|nr:hypothetical protein [Propionibacterium ruminifibrarum]MBE6476945.1 hypothetical protein [Propionibacteriaceae bacterium]SPF69529.1 hypothetical protein PROPJV5_2515 [Propionibacterium ruminifibrarum]
MPRTNPVPETGTSLARGTAIAALVYHGATLLVAMALAMVYGPVIFIFGGAALSMEDYNSRAAATAMVFLLMLIIALVVVASPVALAVWMMIAERRNNSGQVGAALIGFSLLAGLALIAVVTWLLTSGPGAPTAVLLMFLPECVIIILGWIGWARMRGACAPGPFPNQMHIGPHPTPVQQHASHHGRPLTPPTSPWQGQESPWPAPGRMG